jgi:hypothetical protein
MPVPRADCSCVRRIPQGVFSRLTIMMPAAVPWSKTPDGLISPVICSVFQIDLLVLR